MNKTLEEFNWYIDQYKLSLNNDLDRKKIFDFLSQPELEFNKTAQEYRESYPNKTDDQIIEALSCELKDKVETIHKYSAEIERLSNPEFEATYTHEDIIEESATNYAKRVWGDYLDSTVHDGTDMTNGEITIKDYTEGYKQCASRKKELRDVRIVVDPNKVIISEPVLVREDGKVSENPSAKIEIPKAEMESLIQLLKTKISKHEQLNELNNTIISKKDQIICICDERISAQKKMIEDLEDEKQKWILGNKTLIHSNNLLREKNEKLNEELNHG